MSTSSKLITVAVFSQAFEAHISRARLEACGIPAFIRDEHTITTNWLYSNALGGVKLQVRAPDASRASRVLAEDASAALSQLTHEQALCVQPRLSAGADAHLPASLPGAAVTLCPQCGSRETHYETFSRRLVFLSVLLLGIPLPWLSRTWRCDSCGFNWKMRLFRRHQG